MLQINLRFMSLLKVSLGPGSSSWLELCASNGDVCSNFMQVGHSNNLPGTIVSPINTWYHLAYTHTGTTGSLYVNGVLDVSSASLPSSSSFNVTRSTNLIGLRDYGSTAGDLDLDDIRFYNRALTASEINALYSAV